MSQNTQIDVFSDLIALQVGIIHPKISRALKSDDPLSIDKALASMSVDDARACKRNFRKLLRKASTKNSRLNWMPVKKRQVVHAQITVKAYEMIKGLEKNDET
jgi:hypothetical protein